MSQDVDERYYCGIKQDKRIKQNAELACQIGCRVYLLGPMGAANA